MKEKKIVVNDREYTIKELKYKDMAEIADLDKTQIARKMIILSTDMKEEDYDELTMSDGVKLQQEINELNNLTDFQNPLPQKKE